MTTLEHNKNIVRILQEMMNSQPETRVEMILLRNGDGTIGVLTHHCPHASLLVLQSAMEGYIGACDKGNPYDAVSREYQVTNEDKLIVNNHKPFDDEFCG